MQMQITHSLVLAVVSLGLMAHGAPAPQLIGGDVVSLGLTAHGAPAPQLFGGDIASYGDRVSTNGAAFEGQGTNHGLDASAYDYVIRPKQTQVNTPVVHQTTDTQPIDIIQPMQDVVQPVVDTHIKPIHSETTMPTQYTETTMPTQHIETQEPYQSINYPNAASLDTVDTAVVDTAVYRRQDCGCGSQTNTPIAYQSTDTQPIEVTQPMEDVVQPVVNKHISPDCPCGTTDTIETTTDTAAASPAGTVETIYKRNNGGSDNHNQNINQNIDNNQNMNVDFFNRIRGYRGYRGYEGRECGGCGGCGGYGRCEGGCEEGDY